MRSRSAAPLLALVAAVACHASARPRSAVLLLARTAPPAGLQVGALDGNALQNELLRYLAIAAPAADTAAQVNAAFLAGDFRAFDTWAELVAAGKITGSGAPATPHAQYFAKLAAAPARERDAVLGIMVAGRRAHAGLADPTRTPAQLAACDGTCATWLVGYLAAFAAPALAVDPTKPLGEDARDYSRTPDELLVGLVGDYAIGGAVGDLERLLQVERRFYQLFTDYGTSPHEVGGLYRAALLALVKIGRAHPSPAIAKALRDYAAALGKPDPSGTGTVERIWREEDDEGGPGAPGAGPSVREAPAEADDSKVPSLGLAAKALDGDDAALAALGGAPRLAGFTWARAVDYELGDVLRRFPGAVTIAGDVLYYVDGRALGAIDLATGDERWRNALQPEREAWPGQFSASWIAVTPSGAPALPAYVQGELPGASERGVALVLQLDPASGEIVGAAPWGAGEDTFGSPDYFGVNASGAYLQLGQSAWKTAWDRARDPQPFSAQLAEGGALRVAGDKVAVVGDGKLRIVGAGGVTLVDTTLDAIAGVKLAAGEQGYYFEGSLTLTSAAFYFVSGDSTIYAGDYHGRSLGKLRFEALTEDALRPCGDALCALATDGLHILTGADQTTVALPPSTRDFAADGLGQAFLTGEDTIVILTRGVARTVDVKHAQVQHLVGLTPACVVVTTYSEPQSLLACLPR